MKAIKIHLLQKHISKAISQNSISSTFQRVMRSLGAVEIEKTGFVSHISVHDQTTKKRIGIIDAFDVTKNNKPIYTPVENEDLEAELYLATPSLQGLNNLQNLLTNYLSTKNNSFKEHPVYFIIKKEENDNIVANNSGELNQSALSGFSQLSNISDIGFTGGHTETSNILITLHQEETKILRDEIEALKSELAESKVIAENEKKILLEEKLQIETNLFNVNAELMINNSTITNVQNQLNSVKNQLQQKNTQMLSLTSQLNTANSQKTTAQNQLTSANSNVTYYRNLYQTAQSVSVDIRNTHTHAITFGTIGHNIIVINGVKITPSQGKFTINNVII